MSDYCSACRYDPGKRAGEQACPFNSLYWDFLHRHRATLAGNHRLAMIYRSWDRMTEATRQGLLKQASHYRAALETL